MINIKKFGAYTLFSCVQLTVSSCLMHSMVASRALVPLEASSSTAFTVFSKDVTLVTITWTHRCKAYIYISLLRTPLPVWSLVEHLMAKFTIANMSAFGNQQFIENYFLYFYRILLTYFILSSQFIKTYIVFTDWNKAEIKIILNYYNIKWKTH